MHVRTERQAEIADTTTGATISRSRPWSYRPREPGHDHAGLQQARRIGLGMSLDRENL